MKNPSDLTPRQRDAMSAVVDTGKLKLAARKMGCSPKTVEIHMAAARKKMGADNLILSLLQWDRLHRG